MLTGAVIGRAFSRRPSVAMSFAFASHFVLDAAPHLDSNDLYGSTTGWTAPEVGIALADVALGCVLVLALTRARSWRRVALWGAAFAFIIDPLYIIPRLGPWLTQWSGTAWLDRFHHGIQPDVSPDNLLVGFGTQAVVIAVAVWLLRRRDSTDRTHGPPCAEANDT